MGATNGLFASARRVHGCPLPFFTGHSQYSGGTNVCIQRYRFVVLRQRNHKASPERSRNEWLLLARSSARYVKQEADLLSLLRLGVTNIATTRELASLGA